MLLFKRIKKGISNPCRIFAYLSKYGIFDFISDERFLKLYFKGTIGEKLNLANPQTFNEKLQWLKLNDRKPLYIKLVDKYEVRSYVKKIIGEEYLIPLLGVWDKFDEIDFSKLPNKFVIKCTHDSGGLVICRDKTKFDIVTAKMKINKSMKKNFFYYGREWPYKSVKPRIICESYLEDETEDEIKDYKFMCFNGKVLCSFVCSNRHSSSGLRVDFYDVNWNHMPFERHYKNSGVKINKPKNYDKMILLAEKLSSGIPFVRVDFYEVIGQVFFGELTFYPGSGFEEFNPVSYDYLLGSWIELPINK